MSHAGGTLWNNEYEFKVDEDFLLDKNNIVYLVLGPPTFTIHTVGNLFYFYT